MTTSLQNSLSTLNPAQSQAVFHDGGPLLIVAGAGTGKTKVITSRILNLIESGKAAPAEILALTFTEKAAQEMTERVDGEMSLSHEEVWIKTFHGFAEKILREKAEVVDLKSDYKVYAKLDQWIFFKKHLFEFELKHFRPLNMPTQFISALLEHFSRVKEEFIKPDEYISYALKNLESVKAKLSMSEQEVGADGKVDPKTVIGLEIAEAEKTLEIAHAYAKYEELMRAENALDFGDLSFFVLRLFEEHPEVLAEYREKFKYVMVDEFQDTNYAQFRLLMLLADHGTRNIVVVGDDDQSIFRWRGASLSNIIQFEKAFPEVAKVVLVENYRSNQNILDASHFFVKFNDPNRLEAREGISKALHSQRDEVLPIECVRTADYFAEVDFVVEKINELAMAGVPLREIAVLVRSNKNAVPFSEAFEAEDIPYQVRSSKGMLSLPEIKDIVAIVKVVAGDDSCSDTALFRVLNFDIFGLNADDVNEVFRKTREQAKKGGDKTSFDILAEAATADVLPGFEDDLTRFVQFIHRVREFAQSHTANETIAYFLNESGYMRDLEERFTRESEKRKENLGAFSKIIKEFEDKASDSAGRSIKAFAEYLRMVEESGIPITDKDDVANELDAVQILTAHGAKGLEFDTVFVVNLVEGRFPVMKRADPLKVPEELTKEILGEGDFRIEEERRLFYVALTRAKRKLYLTYAPRYEGNKEWKKSQFLEEIGESGLIEEKEVGGGGAETGAAENLADAGGEKLTEVKPTHKQPQTIRKIPTAWENYKNFSYSQIDTFRTCPLKYACRYVINLSEPASQVMTFGTTLHNTLDDFYKQLDVTNAETYSLENLQKIYKEKWSANGFESKEHEEARIEQGLEILREFHEKNSKPWVKPMYLEKDFHVKIGDYMISGRIDRIDRLEDGTFEVIDYKTTKSKALDKNYQLQLHVYALACRDFLHIPVSKLSVYFLEDNVKASLKKGVSDLDSLKDDLKYYMDQAKKSKFPPTPGHQCSYCGFRLICPAV